MESRIWGGVLAACSLLACGGSASSTHNANANANGGEGGRGSEGGSSASANGGDAGTTGDDASEAGSGSGVHLAPDSWEVTGVVSVEPKQNYFCDKIDFSLTVDGDKIFVGRDGEMHSAAVQNVDGAYLATSLELPKGACNVDRLLVKQLRLRGIDNDGDGEADELEATATLDEVHILAGDTSFSAKLSIALKAVPDDTEPKLSANSTGWAMLNPLDRVYVIASEPIDASTKVTLTDASDPAVVTTLASDPPGSGPVIGFYPPQILPLGGTWHLDAEGKDLAGHALTLADTIVPLSTLADPGVYTPDGFEGALSGMIGSPKTVTSYGSVPAISGEHSLWLEPSSQLLIHLRRQGTEKNLHFVVRGFAGPNGSVYETKNVRAGVVGGTHVVTLSPKYPSQQTSETTGDAALPSVGGSMEFDAELDDAGQDVILSISNSSCQLSFGFPCLTPSAWMLDDLTFE